MKLFKKIQIPSGEKVEVTAYQSWVVRWSSYSDYGSSYAAKRPESEIFTQKEDAERFASELRQASALLKNTCSIGIVIEDQTK